VRATSQAALRIREAGQMGFTRCVLPDGNVVPGEAPPGMELIGVRTVGDALDALM
jgi:DNA repair protein RadA/Sms